MNRKKAVFFDFGDTLASTNPLYIHRIAMAMRGAGYGITDREFEEVYLRADYELYLKHKAMGGITPGEHRAWFFPILYSELSPPGDVEVFRQKVRDEMSGLSFSRAAVPGAVQLLEDLKSKGYILGVISNNDGNTEEKCDEVGIRDYFDFIFDSTLLGLIKPDPRIFRLAAERAGVLSSQAVHVGDMYGSDVLGGMNAGLDVVWFNGRNAEKLDGTVVKEASVLSEVAGLIE